MSAPNFYKKNAKNYYCIENYYDKFIDIPEKWEICKGYDNYRYYGMDYLMERDFKLQYCGTWFYCNVRIGMRCGYFSGANYDYDLQLCSDCFGYNDIDGMENRNIDQLITDCIACVSDYTDNKGLILMNKKNIEKKLSFWLQNIISQCETICRDLSEIILQRAGIFSSGEAIYDVLN